MSRPPIDVGPSAFPSRLSAARVPPIIAPDIPEAKRIMRREMRTLRRAQKDEKTIQDNALCHAFHDKVKLEDGAIVAGYHALADELDPAVLMAELETQGHPLALPVTSRTGPLTFRLYASGDPLRPGPMGILEPLPEARCVMPDVLLVPLLAFDAQRRRLGYGGGFYDRTIDFLRQSKKILALGIAYDFQEVPQVPTDAHDARLDLIVTESRIV